MVTYREAKPSDREALAAVARAAKAHWDYPAEWLELWRDELVLSPEEIDAWYVPVAETEGRIVAFAAVSRNGDQAEIEHLWVLPSHMGQGLGRALFGRAIARCRERGVTEVEVVSDPNALGFYQAMGGELVRHQPTQPAPRTLPVLRFVLSGQELL